MWQPARVTYHQEGRYPEMRQADIQASFATSVAAAAKKLSGGAARERVLTANDHMTSVLRALLRQYTADTHRERTQALGRWPLQLRILALASTVPTYPHSQSLAARSAAIPT